MKNEVVAKDDYLVNPQSLDMNTVKRYIDPKGRATDQELNFFLATCKARDLNPFIKEVYFIKYDNSQSQIVVSKDAMMKRAEQNSNYRGFEAGIYVEDNQTGDVKKITGTVYNKKRGALIGGWCKVYRSDRDLPIEADADFDAYNTNKSMWAKMPALMIRKVAIVSAMREAFSETIGGLYTSDEMEQSGEPIRRETKQDVAERRLKEAEAANKEIKAEHAAEVIEAEPAEPVEEEQSVSPEAVERGLNAVSAKYDIDRGDLEEHVVNKFGKNTNEAAAYLANAFKTGNVGKDFWDKYKRIEKPAVKEEPSEYGLVDDDIPF